MVAVARRMRYGGLPRPAEWLAILIGLTLVVKRSPDVDEVVNQTWAILGFDDGLVLDDCGWFWAGVALVVALGLLGATVAGRNATPYGLRDAPARRDGGGPALGADSGRRPGVPLSADLEHPTAAATCGLHTLPCRAGTEEGARARCRAACCSRCPAWRSALEFRNRRSAWTWVEWAGALAGLTIATGGLLISGIYVTVATGGLLISGISGIANPIEIENTIRSLRWPLAALLALGLVHWLRPAWNRAVGSG